MDGISDITMGAIEYALDGVAARADARAHNLANANTPGYQARTVRFEDALAEALDDGDLARVAPSETTTVPGAPDPLGNTVSMEAEMTGAIEDNLMFQSLIRTFNSKVTILRTAVGGGA